MGSIDYIETACKSALNRVSGMPFRWSLNPYRGCVHGCHYCYARATHAYLGFDAGDDFSTKIVVKTNMPEVLRRELARLSWAHECVALGTATDAYQPCEGRYRITRKLLEALRDFRTPVSVVTKSTLVLRDRDLWVELARLPGTRVNVTVTTLDPLLWRLLEPGTPPPARRLDVMRRLADAGVPCGLFMAPVLPGLTDSEAAMAEVAEAACDAGAELFWGGALRLAPLVREHYLAVIAKAFPALLPDYERAFRGANAPAGYRVLIEERMERVGQRAGFALAGREAARERHPGRAGSAPTAGQLPLPL